MQSKRLPVALCTHWDHRSPALHLIKTNERHNKRKKDAEGTHYKVVKNLESFHSKDKTSDFTIITCQMLFYSKDKYSKEDLITCATMKYLDTGNRLKT